MTVGFALIISSAAPVLATVEYSLTDIGIVGPFNPGEENSEVESGAAAINNAGQVVGTSTTITGLHAYLYSAGILQDLGTLGGPQSGAYGINALGEVAGQTYLSPSNANSTAFVYSGGVMQPLGWLGSIQNSEASAINDLGEIVGYSTTTVGGNNVFHAFLYSNGKMADLGTLRGGLNSFARGINDSGEIVGDSDDNAFLYSGGQMTNLGGLPGSNDSGASAINDAGEIVGSSSNVGGVGGPTHAFLFSNGLMTDLGTLGGMDSNANGINNLGEVVGSAETGSAQSDAYLYTNGAMVDLNSMIDPNLGWHLSSADGINDEGQIVGYGINPSGNTDSFLLTPVPEPTAALIIPVLAVCALARRNKKTGLR